MENKINSQRQWVDMTKRMYVPISRSELRSVGYNREPTSYKVVMDWQDTIVLHIT